VTVIHDVHIWTITSGNEVFSAHILMDPSYQGDLDQMTTRMQNLLHDRYSIGHVTLQLERTLEGCTENHHVGHLLANAR
jgi:cobalt-zinc-cadmium efflux system protein